MKLLACLYRLENRDRTCILESRNQIEEKVTARVTPRLKRRLTPLGIRVTQKLFGIACVNNEEHIPWVVASRHGDTDRVGRLLTSLAKGELISPTDFSMSVHNAIIGNFSIETRNQKMHTALSGGDLSFSAGLLEAYALQKESKGRVGYLYYDSTMPKEYDDQIYDENIKDSNLVHVCIALLLGDDENSSLNIAIDFISEEKSEAKAIDILSLINFLEKNENEYKVPVRSGYFHLERHQL